MGDEIRIGVVGCGRILPAVLRGFRLLRASGDTAFRITALCARKPEDAMMTYKFLKKWRRLIKLNWQLFSIYVFEKSALAARAEEFGIHTRPLPDTYLVEAMRYTIDQELSQEASVSMSIRINEKLKRYLHPLNKIMDIESMKQLVLAFKSKDMMPGKSRR